MRNFEDVPAVTGEEIRERLAESIDNGQALQQVKTSYTTAVAVQKPRSLSKMVAAVLAEAELAGSSFYYRWEAAGKEIIGGSIDMAASIFRSYGNCAMDIQCRETNSHYFFTATFVDLENGGSWPRMFRQRKSQSLGKRMDQDRQEDIVFQIGQSKAMRNAVLSIMPRWIIDQATQKARNAEIARLSGKDNIELARAEMLKYFGRFGVTKERLEAKIGKPIEDTAPEDLADLRSVAGAIKDGLTTITEAFPVQEKDDNAKPENPSKYPSHQPKEEKRETAQESPAPQAAVSPAQPAQPKEEPPKAPPPPAPSEEQGPNDDEPFEVDPRPAEAPAGNPFDDRDAWKRFRVGTDGLSNHYWKNRKKWDSASAGARREFAEKWAKCYPNDRFPGEVPSGPSQVEPPSQWTPAQAQPSERHFATPFAVSEALARENEIRDMVEGFTKETIREAKKKNGFLTGDNVWPSTLKGCKILHETCKMLVPKREI